MNIKNLIKEMFDVPAKTESTGDRGPINFQKHFVLSGKANQLGTKETTVDIGQLSRGIEIEYEHTTHYEIAKRIALDHLAEIPDYYTRLAKMEEEAKRGINDVKV